MIGGSRLRQAGWAMALGIVFTLFVALTFRVHAVKSEVVRAERQIIALKQETMRLETEFETRANQQQLANWNAVDFGYVAPTAGQYLENERQLASLAQPLAPGAPDPIRVARAPQAGEIPEMVSPLTGKPVETLPASYQPKKPTGREQRSAEDDRPSLAERLGMTAELAPGQPGFGQNPKVAE
ncbi:hypothetical protein [Parerythrobacter aestuarii]|uniref:hypothetical protein n=1 Tax=Parerythrobacter aestuarii TaxID=3020909 RepID=UPI0024DE61F8|nr:hypothetical protein [Parerythrobacter aestuarii]